MMEKIKKISVEQLRTHNKPSQRTILWHGIAVTIRYLLPIKEVTLLVNSVMDGCYDKAHDVFIPEMMDFAFRVNIVTRYACVDLPQDIEEQYEILYNTDIFDTIASAINTAQMQSIKDTIYALMFKAK